MTASAFAGGMLSAGHVAAIVANLSDATVGLFAAQEAELVPVLAPLDVREAARAMGHWRQRAEATLPDDDPGPDPKRSLHHSQTLDGRWATDGDFDAEGGSGSTPRGARARRRPAPGLEETADLRVARFAAERLTRSSARRIGVSRGLISSHLAPTSRASPPAPAQRRADALVDLCRWFLDHHDDRRSGRRRLHLNVVIAFEELLDGLGSVVGATSGAGTLLDATTMRRLCDAGVHRVLTAGASSILDYGRATRTIPPNLWAALVVHDRHYRFPGCDRGPQWCEAHHSVPWKAGGTTDPTNLFLGCGRHHHLWHRPGWHTKLLPDGELHITNPAGRVLVSRPPP